MVKTKIKTQDKVKYRIIADPETDHVTVVVDTTPSFGSDRTQITLMCFDCEFEQPIEFCGLFDELVHFFDLWHQLWVRGKVGDPT